LKNTEMVHSHLQNFLQVLGDLWLL